MVDQLSFVQIVKNNMRFLHVLKFYFLIFFSVVAEEFVFGLDDIPVFKEMRYVENSNLLFDKIDGRFVSSEMEGSYNKEDIKQFYSSVLPNLGWKKVDENLYLRDGEYLEIKLNSLNSVSKVKFSIYPK